MAFKEKHILGVFMFIWFSFIKMSVYAVFNEGKKPDSLGSFYKSARTNESFDRGDDSPKSGEKVGRLLIWQDQASSSLGDGNDRFSSDPGFQSRPDDNAYQSDDPGWMKLQPLWGQVYGLNTLYTPTVERLLDIKPKVDCVGDLMKLTVHGRGAPFGSSFLIDRGSLQPLPLSQLPSECGHRFLRTWRDFVFIMPYDGCYVSQEKDTFVLPLLWLGLPVKMSCSSPTSAQRAPTVSCYTNGMIVRLYRRVSEKLKIKVMNEWQPLLKGSARCGYSLVSHAEGVVIHAPYMPCTEPEDGMFTLSMVLEKEFNLSCPALTSNVPISLPDHAPTNYIPTSMPNAPISPTLSPTTTATSAAATTTTQPISTSSTVQKFPAPPLPYYIPVLPNLKPVPPSYPFLGLPPNVLPTVLPQGPSILGRPTAINQQPHTPVYVNRPPAWYPWKPMQYPRKHLLPPTKAPKTPVGPLLKPTSIPQDELTSTIPIVPPAKWAPMFPARNVGYPSYPRKPFVPPSTVFPQDPYWLNSQNQPIPSISVDDPPMPAPTRKAGPPLFHPWYKPFPPRLPVMLPVPTKVPPHNTVFTTQADKGHPINPGSDISHSIPQLPEVVNTPAPINASLTRICSSHAHSFYGQTFCPCPPLISFHHHNHRYFGHHPFFNLDSSSLTKIPGQMLSSPVISAGPTQLKWPSRLLQNGPVAEPLVYSNLKPAVYQAPMEQYVLPQQHLTQEMLVAPNKVPFFEKMVQYAISSKPTMPPGHGKPLYMNHWYQPTYSNAKPPISDSPTEDPSRQLSLPDPSNNDDTFEPLATPPQPELSSGGNLPGMNPLQYNSQSGESVVPVFRNTYWVPAVQTNQDALPSPAKTQMGSEMSIHSPWNLERWKR